MNHEYFRLEYEGNDFGVQVVPSTSPPDFSRNYSNGALYDPTVPLLTQLANVFHLRTEYYATNADFHIDDTLLHTSPYTRRYRLGRFALQALDAEFLHGQLGLAFVAHDLCRASLEGRDNLLLPSLAYHGSPAPLTEIDSRQANWQDGQGRLYADGPTPTIRASATTDFPVMRALLHESRPELAQMPLVLLKKEDSMGRTHWFTSEEALKAVRNATGYVHVIDPQTNRNDAVPSRFDYTRQEYVITGKRRSLARVRVTSRDLPASLYVIAAADRDQLANLVGYTNPREFSDALGIRVRPLGGMWPATHYPRR